MGVWGTVPEWLGAIGTVAAAIFALVFWRADQAKAERAQAGQIRFKLRNAPVDDGSGEMRQRPRISVFNFSSEMIVPEMAVVRLKDDWPTTFRQLFRQSFGESGGDRPEGTRVLFTVEDGEPILHSGSTAFFENLPELSLIPLYMISIRFKDALGRPWHVQLQPDQTFEFVDERVWRREYSQTEHSKHFSRHLPAPPGSL